MDVAGPKPIGVFLASGGTPSTSEIAMATKLAREVELRRRLAYSKSEWGTLPLDGGGYIRASSIGEVTKAVIYRPASDKKAEIEDDLELKYSVPMVYSARVVTPRVIPKSGVELQVSKSTQRRLVNYDKEKTTPEKQVLQRFEIPPGIRGSEFAGPPESKFLFTQYNGHYPTWFSGSMAKVVQLVAGYGKQKFTDGSEEEIKALTKKEMKRIVIPAAYREAMGRELVGYTLYACTGNPPDDGTIQFGYQHYETDGVCFDSDKKPWLVRIKSGTVLAMPLPMIPMTTTKTFRKYMEKVSDDEIITALDLFGGLPSGEGFPVGEKARAAWKKAGVIIDLCDTADFYSGSAMAYSPLGWSFSEDSNEAVHTCHVWGDDAMQRARYYKFKAKLGPVKLAEKITVDADESRDLGAYLAELYGLIPKDMEGSAIKFKINANMATAIDLSKGFVPGRASVSLSYWENLVSPPIANGSGSVTKTSEGRIHSRAKFKYQPQLKLPSPYLGGCVSHDFNSDPRLKEYSEAAMRFDTIVWAYFIKNTLKVIRFSQDNRSKPLPSEDDFDDCMLVGSWTSTATTGNTRMMGQFTTSDFDERETSPETKTVTKIKGDYLGVDSEPRGGFVYPYRAGGMNRSHWFMETTDTTSDGGVGKSIGVCVPYLTRDAVLYATSRTQSHKTTSWSQRKYSRPDAWFYDIYTYSFIFHWYGGIVGVANGLPHPKNGFPSYTSFESHNDSPCASYCDKGPYLTVTQDVSRYRDEGGFEGADKPAPSIPPVGPKALPSRSTGGDPIYAGSVDVSIVEQPWRVTKSPPDEWYFRGSPSDDGGVFYRSATRNCLGESEYAAVLSVELGENDAKRGYTKLAPKGGVHYFIGVINA
ncbi:hypothetical protein [Propionivibrio sp.]|uniref:hypothetical protein n=1 Tax=Propionivibrio sp. TaxID=2212460 RepID=UPI003BF0F1BB